VTTPDNSTISLDDAEDHRFYARVSRSGKRLIVTVSNQGYRDLHQVELRVDQVAALIEFLAESLPGMHGDE
jgi:hypothetical protein